MLDNNKYINEIIMNNMINLPEDKKKLIESKLFYNVS